MNSLLIVLTFCVLSISCAFQPIATLDNFSGSQNLIIVTNDEFPASTSSFLNSTSVYGGQRDLELIVESGGPTQVFVGSVANNLLSLSSPNGADGYTIYQLDGVDDSVNINQNGLGNFDATFAGSANAFQITGFSDVASNLNITVYTSTGVGKYHLKIASSLSPADYFILYSSFSGTPNFASVGAIEIFFDGSSDVDSVFSFFGIVGGSASSESTADNSPVSPVSPAEQSPITAKANSNDNSSDDSAAGLLLPCMIVLCALFALF